MIKLSARIKYYLLLTAILIVGLAAYHIALKPTFELRQVHKELTIRYYTLQEAPEKIPVIRQRLSELDDKIATSNNQGGLRDELILAQIGELANAKHVSVVQYPGVHRYHYNNIDIITHKVVLKGSFKNLLQTLHAMETTHRQGILSSVRFYSEVDRRTKERMLFSEIYIQIIHKDVTP